MMANGYTVDTAGIGKPRYI